MLSRNLRALLLGCAVCVAPLGHAADWNAVLVAADGSPLENAVLTLKGASSPPVPVETAVMDQQHMRFVPQVLAVHTGTPVSFPNSDDIRHQVYSFSPAKRFELKLYHGTPTAPVVFDQPGLVVLGCNIHDSMVGYIYVSDDPWIAVSDAEGHVSIPGLPAGTYTATLWHPDVNEGQPQAGTPLTVSEGSAPMRLTVKGDHVEVPAVPEAPADGSFEAQFRSKVRDAQQ